MCANSSKCPEATASVPARYMKAAIIETRQMTEKVEAVQGIHSSLLPFRLQSGA